jgi:ammonia channel protein AmtB
MNLDGLLDGLVREIVNPFIWLLTGVATVIFIYGVLEFLGTFGSGDDARAKGKSHMVWGIVGLAIMIGVFGILSLVLNTFGIEAPKGA